MHIARSLFEPLKNNLLNDRKIIILYGPRQVGKTTLVNHILREIKEKKIEINADEKKYIDVLSSRDLQKMKLLVEGYDLLFIDEAQRIPDIGINLKILHDGLPDLKIIATGSSSFDLANKIKEPLTGRSRTFILYPISFHELTAYYNAFELQNRLEEYLVFGMYPELFSLPNSRGKSLYLQELSSAYLYKDILEISSIKHSAKIHNLLRLLAFQIGSEVSFAELGRSLQMSKDTVETYINLLEKSFVLFRVSGFSRNLRKEVTKMDKIYFYDLGVRNSIINNFNTFDYRDDQGKLWENFLMIERKKVLSYQFLHASMYFWRTYTGAELDYVEERDGQTYGFEFKFNQRQHKTPQSWKENYPDARYQCINLDNFHHFITGDPALLTG
jgi:predicted AAA+ superfamily ATPase